MKIQKTYGFIAAGVALVALVAVGVYQFQLLGPRTIGAELTGREGTVEYRVVPKSTSDTTGWKKADADLSVGQNYEIRTGTDSRAIINLDDGSAIRLAANSTVLLDTLTTKHMVIANRGGRVYTRVVKSSQRIFEVTTSKSTYRSLGTAYQTIDMDGSEGVEVYHSKVSVLGAASNGDVIVEQGSRYYRVNTKEPDAVGKVTEISREQIAADSFIQWNAEQDGQEFKNDLGVLFDTKPPTLEVSAPASGLVTAAETVAVTGTTEAGAKVTVNGDTASSTEGKFSLRVQLEVGANAFKVEATDGAGNKTVKTLTVTRSAPPPAATATPTPTRSFKLYGTKVDKGISFSWSISGIAATKGFKLVKSSSANPVYPGSDYQYISEPAARSYTWNITDGQTYHFRICTYTGSGCDSYSNDITVSAPSVSAGPKPSGTLSLVHGSGSNFSWTLNGSAPLGYKLVWSADPAPVYPGSDYQYYSDPATTTGSITTDAGTYHVRVCLYAGGSCTGYSNELIVTVP